MKRIEIHGTDDKGVPFIINRMTSDNIETSNGNTKAKREALLNKASKMAGEWSKVFPHDKFRVVEV